MKLITKLLISAILTLSVATCGSAEKYKEVKPENGIVKIDVSSVSDGKAHYYHMKDGGKDIKFFVLKSSDGVIRAAFDACDVCYPEKKGYRQEGDYMVCNNCGQQFESSQINEVRGGCNPSPLERKSEGNYITFSVSDIKKGSFYF